MPLNKENCKTFQRTLYAGQLESVTLLKRRDDQRQGTVVSHTVWDCRWSRTFKSGEPIQADWASSHRRVLHIPIIELERVGVEYINALDKFIDEEGRHWQPESGQTITIKLFQDHVCVDCVRCDPPRGPKISG